MTVLNAVIGAGLIGLSFTNHPLMNVKRRQLARFGGILLIAVAAFMPPILLLINTP